jgi:hypothetical protein
MKMATLSLLLLCTFAVPPGRAAGARRMPEAARLAGQPVPSVPLCCWYLQDHGLYCVALDLSFGYIPSEGQKHFKTYRELLSYLAAIYPPEEFRIEVIDGYPGGDQGVKDRALTREEMRGLERRKTPRPAIGKP